MSCWVQAFQGKMSTDSRNGKLSQSPRGKSPYRQLNKKVTLILTLTGLFIVVTGNVQAIDTPTKTDSLIKPPALQATSSANLSLNLLTPVPTKPINDLVISTNLIDLSPTPTASTDSASQVSTPEITADIQSEEYIPPAPDPAPSPVVRASSITSVALVYESGNHFSYGYCTWYVANRRSIPWFGNAGAWYSAAQAYGFSVGSSPAPGAIMVSYEGAAAGHVAYVESVGADGSFTVSEMNYNSNWGRVTYRTITPGSTYIVGFIY